MSLSIRTLKIVIGILVLVSMILSMVPMFGMAPVGRSMSKFSRQVTKLPRAGARVGTAPISAVPHTYTAPQAVKRPAAMPTFSSGLYETHDYGTLGISGMPSFPEAPKPIVITPPPVQTPKTSTQEQLFGNTVTAEFNTVAPEPKIQLPATALLPGASVIGVNPAAVKVEPTQVVEPEIQAPVEIIPPIEVGEAIQSQPQTGTVTSTPAHANSHEFVEQRAEAVHIAPVVGKVQSEQGTVKAGEVIEAPVKIERSETEPAKSVIAIEQGATRVPKGELGNVVEQAQETVTLQQTPEPALEQSAVIEQGKTSDAASQAGIISSNTGTIVAGTVTTAAAAPIVGQAVTAEPIRGTVKITPAGTGLERPIVVPAPEIVTPIEHGDASNQLKNKRAHAGKVLQASGDIKPEDLRRQTTLDPQIERAKIEEVRRNDNGRRGNNNNGGRRGPRRAQPARPVVGPGNVHNPAFPAVNPAVPVIPAGVPVDEVAEGDGGMRAVPFPPLPRPRVDAPHGLPPARGVSRSWLDDLEKRVIQDKNQIYNGRFENNNPGASTVDQVLPTLRDVPASVEKSARDFVNQYQHVNTVDEASYSEFINSYNTVMDAIKRERAAK